jgi:hypothetical protein
MTWMAEAGADLIETDSIFVMPGFMPGSHVSGVLTK